ncbi:MAG TPA: DNA-processing protein DprA [Candidatus Binatia bacterium]|nr:DNA-processing protein DprA [Candidatus Binatia bacterium]
MARHHEVAEIAAPTGLEAFFNGKAPKLRGLGAPAIQARKLLGIICARQIDSDLALKSSRLVEELALCNELAFVGGWHSPAEKGAFRILSSRGAPLVFCLAKALDHVVLSQDLDRRVSQGQVLLLTHCSSRARRISRQASLRRNQVVAGLADAVVFLSAPAESASWRLATSALRHGKPVFAPDHRINKEILSCGALPATFERIRAALA